MAESKEPSSDDETFYVPHGIAEIDYRSGEEPGRTIVVSLVLMELAPNFPRPGDTPQRLHVMFPNPSVAIGYFQSLANRLKEFDA